MTRSLRITPALGVATLALVMACGGTSVAAKLVTGAGIKNNSVAGVDIKNNSLAGIDVKDGSLTRDDLKAGTTVDTVIPRKRVVATVAATEAAARAAAPEVVLFKKGALTIYAKCLTDSGTTNTLSEIFIKTSQNGAIVDSRTDSLDGGTTADQFLNTNTPELDAQLEADDIGANNSSMNSQDDSDFTAFAPDGTTIRGWTAAAVKNGTLAGGNGVYGAGDVCLFTGAVFAN